MFALESRESLMRVSQNWGIVEQFKEYWDLPGQEEGIPSSHCEGSSKLRELFSLTYSGLFSNGEPRW